MFICFITHDTLPLNTHKWKHDTLSLIPNKPSNITSREKYTFNSTIHLFYIYMTNPDIGYITRYRLQYLYKYTDTIPLNTHKWKHDTLLLIPNNPSNITSREKYTFNSIIHLFYHFPHHFSLIHSHTNSNIFSYVSYFSNN